MFNLWTRACVKVASDLGLGGGFCRLLRFPPPVKTGRSSQYGREEDEKQNSNINIW